MVILTLPVAVAFLNPSVWICGWIALPGCLTAVSTPAEGRSDSGQQGDASVAHPFVVNSVWMFSVSCALRQVSWKHFA